MKMKMKMKILSIELSTKVLLSRRRGAGYGTQGISKAGY